MRRCANCRPHEAALWGLHRYCACASSPTSTSMRALAIFRPPAALGSTLKRKAKGTAGGGGRGYGPGRRWRGREAEEGGFKKRLQQQQRLVAGKAVGWGGVGRLL